MSLRVRICGSADVTGNIPVRFFTDDALLSENYVMAQIENGVILNEKEVLPALAYKLVRDDLIFYNEKGHILREDIITEGENPVGKEFIDAKDEKEFEEKTSNKRIKKTVEKLEKESVKKNKKTDTQKAKDKKATEKAKEEVKKMQDSVDDIASEITEDIL